MFVILPHTTKSGKKSPFWIVSNGIQEFKVSSKRMANNLLNYFEEKLDESSGRIRTESESNSRRTESVRCDSTSNSEIQVEQGCEIIHQRPNSEYHCTDSATQSTGITDCVVGVENRSISIWTEAGKSEELSTDNSGSNQKDPNVDPKFVQQVFQVLDRFAKRSVEQQQRIEYCGQLFECGQEIVLDQHERVQRGYDIIVEQDQRIQRMHGYVHEADRIVQFVSKAVGCGNENFQKYNHDEDDARYNDTRATETNQSDDKRRNSDKNAGRNKRKPIRNFVDSFDAINVEYSPC
jgi:hypothetical protein